MSLLDLNSFRAIFSGEILQPNDEGYAVANITYVGKTTPQMILLPSTVEDVVSAVKFAKDHSLLLSIRSGGHSGVGHSSNDGGMVIDLKNMNKVEVIDKEKGIVCIEGGAVWGDIAKALEPYHLAISSGDTKSVGVGGLTLGGGIGWVVRKYGLALDQLQSAEIVTADGQVLQLSEVENPDLFWAIRGGGGNFGVVTKFVFQAHPLQKVFAGNIIYKADDLKQLLTNWRDYMRTADEELNCTFLAMPKMGENPPMVMLLVCYADDDESIANKALEPLYSIGTVVMKDIKEKSYAEVLEEAHPPQGMKIIVKNALAPQLSDEMIDVFAKHYAKDTSTMMAFIRTLGGAFSRVPADKTAFAYRDSEALIVSAAFLLPDADEESQQKALTPWRELLPHTKGAYINFLGDDTPEDVKSAYPEVTYKRLVEIKKKYDPENLFRRNFNIKGSSN